MKKSYTIQMLEVNLLRVSSRKCNLTRIGSAIRQFSHVFPPSDAPRAVIAPGLDQFRSVPPLRLLSRNFWRKRSNGILTLYDQNKYYYISTTTPEFYRRTLHWAITNSEGTSRVSCNEFHFCIHNKAHNAERA
jgi:hypothetical protein